MAGLRFVAQCSTEISTGTSKKTLLQGKAPTNQRMKVKEISVSFKGTSNTAAPILVEVARQSDNGIGGDVITPQKLDPGYDETIQSTWQENVDGSSQPTQTAVVLKEEVHPQGGYTWQAPFGGEIIIPGGGFLGVAVTAGADVSSMARMVCEE